MQATSQRAGRIAALAGVLVACLLFAGPAHAAGTLPASWDRAFNFTSWTKDGYATDSARQGLRDLQRLGTNRVVLTPTWYMQTGSSDTIARDPAKTPSDASLRTVMREARDLGMSVVVKPHVDVHDGTFRGEITPASTADWFASYQVMLTHYAELAAAGGADTLVVGTELTTMAADTARFEHLIADARAHFPGTLTYAANWIDEAERIGFWDRLDTVGMDAYMPLDTGTETPTVDDLAAAWAPYVQRITDLHARTEKPVTFTELGYQSRTDTLAHPASASGSPDPRIQALAYTAALRVWSAADAAGWFQGIWWWNWEAEPTGDDPAGSFSIAGKPAAAILRDAQGGTAAVDGSSVHSGTERAGAPVPFGAGVLILLALAGTALAMRLRRRPADPRAPEPVQAAPLVPSAPFAAQPSYVGAGPGIGLQLMAARAVPTRTAPLPRRSPAGRRVRASFPPTCGGLHGVFPPRPAAAATRLPSRYQGVAA